MKIGDNGAEPEVTVAAENCFELHISHLPAGGALLLTTANSRDQSSGITVNIAIVQSTTTFGFCSIYITKIA